MSHRSSSGGFSDPEWKDKPFWLLWVVAAFAIGWLIGTFWARHDVWPMASIVAAKTRLAKATGLGDPWRRPFNDTTTGYVAVPCPKDATVIITAGQSNAANMLSDPVDRDPVRSAFMVFGSSCWLIEDPVLGASGFRGSLWTSLGHRLSDATGKNVVFLNAAAGGTTFADWLEPRSGYLDRLAARVAEARALGLEPSIVLWHQGESDARRNLDRATYEAELRALVDAATARAGLSPNLRFVLYRASKCQDSQGREKTSSELIDAQTAIATSDPRAVAGPDTDRLGPRERADGCHFNMRGRDRVIDETLRILLPLVQ